MCLYEVVCRLFVVVDCILWVGVCEYFMFSNISDYVLCVGYVDCGQQILLLIVLLCLNGIFVCWQLGMVFFDDGSGYSNLYDWGQVYLVLFGWLLMDVIIGVLVSDVLVLCDFYLGGFDGYCIVFNDDFGQFFVLVKQYYCLEMVDLQCGEVEWVGGNLYFD